ncbi:BatD family protein [Sulfurimonas sp.]|nr:BatD family protein [Sulfurimonas sp.]
MKYLGKIFLILYIFEQILYAGVSANVDSKHVSYGEVVTYNLVLSGKDIKKPEIYTLCGEDVVGTGSSTSIRVINGEYKKDYVLSYKFVPKKSCQIKQLSLEIDGKILKTKTIDIVVVKFVASINDDFSLTLSTEKNEIYIGEAFDVTLLFRQKKSAQVVDNKFTNPEFKGFWIKGDPEQEVTDDGTYINTKVIYNIAPQREGILEIKPVQIAIASRQNTKNYYGGFFPEVKWKTYFSNDLNITSKAVPSDADLVGDVVMQATTDKLEVNANEAVTVTIEVQGKANFEDLKSFKPYIDGISIFDEKINLQENLLTQKITFVADSSFTVPTFTLKVFNPQSQETKLVSTQEIAIKVNNSKLKEDEKLTIKRKEKTIDSVEKVISKNENYQKLDILWIVLIFLGGILVGIVLMLLKPLLVFKSEKSFNIKDHKILLVKLMPYEDNVEVKELIDMLETNLYNNDNKAIDTKKIKAIVKKYEIS